MDIIASDGSAQPAFVSVEAAARFLGLSRGTGYALAHRYLATGEGLRCTRLGARLLVPVAWLLEISGQTDAGEAAGKAPSGPNYVRARRTSNIERRRRMRRP